MSDNESTETYLLRPPLPSGEEEITGITIETASGTSYHFTDRLPEREYQTGAIVMGDLTVSHD